MKQPFVFNGDQSSSQHSLPLRVIRQTRPDSLLITL